MPRIPRRILAYGCAVGLLFLLSSPPAIAQAPAPADAPSRFATVDGLKVHYRSYGKGSDALVFIHGWTCNMDFWKANYPAFVDQTRVILIDLPGHGRSDKPENTRYSMDLFARAINAVMRDAGARAATLVGHSMGAPVIRQFYRLFPTRTRALVIVDGGLKPLGSAESMKPFLDPFRLPDYQQHARQMVAFLTQGMKPGLAAEVQAAMLTAPQHVMVSAMEEMLNPAIWQTEDPIGVPTLALMAANPQWSGAYEMYVRKLAPGVNYQVWQGVSHFLMLDEPQKFNDTLLAFLRANKLLNK
ncbi:MAG: alpha/beta fold hydrolase [Blastocatellia bacterium]